MVERIEFSKNWNGKLNGDSFTTMRLHDPVKYCVGAVKADLLEGHLEGECPDHRRETHPPFGYKPVRLKVGHGPFGGRLQAGASRHVQASPGQLGNPADRPLPSGIPEGI